MAEETMKVPPASPVIKSGGGDRRKSFDPPRSSISSRKGVPNYLRGSTGSCHENCKHGKQEEHVTEEKESHPWQKPVKESGATAACKRTVMAKPSPSADPKIQSLSLSNRKENTEQDMLIMSGHVDANNEQASSDTKTTVSGELEVSMVSENITAPAEEGSLDTKNLSIPEKSSTVLKVSRDLDLSEKSSTFSKGKPLARAPSPISRRTNLDVKKAFEERKGVKGECKHVGTKPTHKSDINSCSAENNSEGGKNTDEAQSIEGSNTAPEKVGSTDGLNLETSMKGESLGNAERSAKSESSNKQCAAPKLKILTNKPSPSLIPSTLKPPSPVAPSSRSRSRTIGVNKGAEKFSTSKPDAKQVVKAATTVSPSSCSSINAEENTVTKKVRVIRVVPSVRRQKNFTKAEVNEPNVDPVDAIKNSPEKKPPATASAKIKAASSASSLSPAPSVSTSTIRSRITYVPSRVIKSLNESEPKVAIKGASTSGLRKGNAVGSETENHGLSKLKVRSNALVRNTALTRRRSLKKRDVSSGADVQKKTSDSYILRHPSFGRKKNGQILFNKVIEETANRLARTRRSKVLALVGAFETVISIQKKSSAGTKPKAKRIVSSSKTPR